MNDQESHDLLIEIKTEQRETNRRLGKVEDKLEQRKCHTHAEKLRTHDKMIWGALAASAGAALKSFFFTGGTP